MTMPPAASEIIPAMLRAHIKGIVNESPTKLKLVFRGDTFALIRLSPTVSCHHGMNSEMMISRITAMPPARPNQFILTNVFHLHGGIGTFGTVTSCGASTLIPLMSRLEFTRSMPMLVSPACSV